MRQSLENATHTISAETLKTIKQIELDAAPRWASQGILRTTHIDTSSASLIGNVRVKGVALTRKRSRAKRR